MPRHGVRLPPSPRGPSRGPHPRGTEVRSTSSTECPTSSFCAAYPVSTPACATELLNGEIFYTLRKAQIVAESWRRHYNTIRPHASLGYKPPAPRVFMPTFAAWPPTLRRPASSATLAQWRALNY